MSSKVLLALLFNFFLVSKCLGQHLNGFVGNNPGNIMANDGMITSDSQFIFYTNIDSSSPGLFALRLDNSRMQKLNNDPVKFLNVFNGWLYYSKDAGIFRMRTNGLDETNLSPDTGFYLNVIGDWIYYINWAHETSVCKMKIDGSQRQVIYRGHYTCLTSDGESLYFQKIGEAGYYKGSFDGKYLKKISSDKLWSPTAYKEWIFYRDDSKHYQIYRMKTDGTKASLVINDKDVYDRFIVSSEWIYLSNGTVFKRMDLDGKRSQVLYQGELMEIGEAANYVFFRSVHTDSSGNKFDRTNLFPIK